jgi:hypothetical protein
MELLHGHSLNEGGVCTACGCGRAFILHFKLKCRSASPPETHNTDEIRNGLVATLAARKLRLELDDKASRAELAQEIAALTERLDRIDRVAISHAPGYRLTALQLLGWLASRLGWRLDHGDHAPVFRRRDGGHVVFVMAEEENAPACVSSVSLGLGDASASVRREEATDYYLAEFSAPDHPPFAQMLPAGREKTPDILLSELSRISRHPLFWPAIRAVEPLLPR